MTEVFVRPGDPNSTHDLSLAGGGEIFGLRLLDGIESIQEVSDKASSVLASQEGKKFGDWEPGHSHIEQRDWSGGRGQKNFADDRSRFFDSHNLNSWITGKIMPSYQWYLAEGDHRDADQNMPGNVNWIAVIDDYRYLAEVFQAGASYDADAILLWVRRVGNPGTLTVRLRADNSGVPGTVLQTVTIDTDDITDVVSEWYRFTFDSTESLTVSTNYWIEVYGGAQDDADNKWEIGVNMSTNTAFYSSGGSSWTEYAGCTLYYRCEDAGSADNKYHFFFLDQTTLHIISEPASGDSLLFEWDETNDEWDSISPTGDALSGIVKSVAVSHDIAHCARGTGGSDETIWTFDHSGPTGQDDATGGNKADFVLAAVHKEDGPQIWRAENDNHYLSRANVEDFNTDLTFGDDIELPDDFDIVALEEYQGKIWARTRADVWFCVNDKVERLPTGLDRVIETRDFAPMLAKDLFLYITWSHSVERYYQGTLDDMGPWKMEGLPEERRGPISFIESGIGGIFVGIDAGASGVSSVLWNNGKGYHEVWRAPRAGVRVWNGKWQSVSGAKPRLWISAGADLYYLEFAQDAINPLQDSTVNYMHEACVISSTIDMEAAALPKAFRELVAWTENLVSGIEVAVDYQVDEDVGTDNWIIAGTYYQEGEGSVDINEGNRRRIRYRLRLRTNNSDVPPVVEATVLEGFGRVPWKPQYVMILKSGSYSVTWQGLPDHGPDEFLEFLIDASLNSVLFHMRCVWPHVDDKWIVVEPTSVFPEMVDRNTGNWQGSIRVTLSVEGSG